MVVSFGGKRGYAAKCADDAQTDGASPACLPACLPMPIMAAKLFF